MLNDNAKKLVAALRSGDYTQGEGQLTTINTDGSESDCCLGIACKLYIKEGNTLNVNRVPSSGYVSYEYERHYLPHAVKIWLGLQDNTGNFSATDVYNAGLAKMNDNRKSFAEIANKIESEPEGLFE